jgi:hypothetical protein
MNLLEPGAGRPAEERAHLSISVEPGEFSAHQISDATAFIQSLPATARVYVQEWTGQTWRFVFGDDKDRALWNLYRVTPGARFRVCPMSLRS